MTPKRLTEAEILVLFPGLRPGEFRDTSDPTATYNCLAWAAAEDDKWWEPIPDAGYYWPTDAPADYRPSSLVIAYEESGYTVCDHIEPEVGFEKIALFADDSEWTHASRQKLDGTWTSKLGMNQDIEHPSPESIAGGDYGRILCFMKRLTGEGAELSGA